MSEAIPCMPLLRTTDGPLFGAKPGTLSALQNMDLIPGGYAEARGGMEELKPSGGTSADAISAGGHACVHQISTNYGWIRTVTSAGVFSGNRQFQAGWQPFGTAAAVNAAVYFGADLPFSRISLYRAPGGAGVGDFTLVYEYWDGAAWSALTTAETWSLAIDGVNHASWTMPTNWTAVTVGDVASGRVYKYWMRIRVSAVVAATGVGLLWAIGNWVGIKELYSLSHSPRTSATAGTLKRYDQNGTAAEWFSVSTALFSGNASPARAVSYIGRLLSVNGKENQHWDGFLLSSIGNPAFTATITVGAAAAGAGMGAGVWRYYAAWAYGPLMVKGSISGGRYSITAPNGPLYGAGQALDAGVDRTTTVGNEQVLISITGTIPTDASACLIYRTNDLTNVPAGERANHPAFLQGVLTRTIEGTNAALVLIGVGGGGLGTFLDLYPSSIFPRTEAITYDNLPPERQKYIALYQNRLFLGDNDYWYWSDAFLPDAYTKETNYIALAKATGGRHMGGVEFADQMVLFTETQTWGLTNVDLDVPQLYPIALNVGCIAPDSIAVGDGYLIWLAKDGVYAWDGTNNPPVNVSRDWDTTFERLSFESHGGSKAAIHRRRYEVRLSNPDYSTIGAAYRLNLENMQWATVVPTGFSSTLFPLAAVHAPLGNNDPGGLHAVWGKVDYGTGAGEYTLMLGGLTTQDNGTNYTCSATMHFPLPANAMYKPRRILGYYQAADGWGTPSFADASTLKIGSDIGTMNTGAADTGDDYSLIAATPSAQSAGSSDLQFTFSVNSAAGGTVNIQRFFGAILEGMKAGIRRGAV